MKHEISTDASAGAAASAAAFVFTIVFMIVTTMAAAEVVAAVVAAAPAAASVSEEKIVWTLKMFYIHNEIAQRVLRILGPRSSWATIQALKRLQGTYVQK